jgi:transcriptional regulator with XRE-family HTH domain
MEKSVTSEGYKVLLTCLKEARETAGLTQIDMADRLGMTQSQVSKCERGERRLDVIELREWCGVIGVGLAPFVRNLESRLDEPRVRSGSNRKRSAR